MKNKILLALLVLANVHHAAAKEVDWVSLAAVALPAIVGGVGTQWWNSQAADAPNRSYNPVVWEHRDEGDDSKGNHHEASNAGGLQIGGMSAHAKIPNSLSWSQLAPKLEAGIDAKHDKAVPVEERSDDNTQRTGYIKAALSEDCKLEVRGNVSNSMVALLCAGLGYAIKTFGPGLVGK